MKQKVVCLNFAANEKKNDLTKLNSFMVYTIKIFVYSSLVVSGSFLLAVSGRNTTNVPDMIVNVLKNANGKDAKYLIYEGKSIE